MTIRRSGSRHYVLAELNSTTLVKNTTRRRTVKIGSGSNGNSNSCSAIRRSQVLDLFLFLAPSQCRHLFETSFSRATVLELAQHCFEISGIADGIDRR